MSEGRMDKNWRDLVAIWEKTEDEHKELEFALRWLVDVIEAAGTLNLSNGVQLGPTVWYVKCEDAMTHARAILKKLDGQKIDETLGENRG